jgi:hypothetical protein
MIILIIALGLVSAYALVITLKYLRTKADIEEGNFYDALDRAAQKEQKSDKAK